MSLRHLAPVTLQREPRSATAAPVVVRRYARKTVDGYWVWDTSGNHVTRSVNGYLLTLDGVSSGVRATKPTAGGHLLFY